MKPAALFAAVALAACAPAPAVPAQRPAPAFAGSCATPVLGVCTEYNDDGLALGEELLKASCAASLGSWSPARCPTARRLGACALHGRDRLYSSGGERGFTPASASLDCTELYQGRWAPAAVPLTRKETSP
jgi:hypothetical protein